MSTRKPTRYAPDNTCHPGETLREILDERRVVHRQFAAEIGITAGFLCDFLKCRRGAGTLMALRLEKALGISAEFWLTQQMHRDLAGARMLESAAKKKATSR